MNRSRLWIIQEVILAPEIWIQCGSQATLTSTWNIQISYNPDDYSVLKLTLADEIAGSLPKQFFDHRSDRVKKGRVSLPLLELCSKYGDAKCEDIRDKVFGLHTLADTCCRDAVLVDYSLPWYKICGTVLHHHMLKHTPKDPSYLINISHEFHGKMQMSDIIPSSEQQSDPFVDPGSEPKDGKRQIEAVGYFRGRISYVSPSLNKISPREEIELPIFDSSVALQLRYISNLREEYQSQHPNITAQTDLVWSPQDSSSYAERLRKSSFGDYLVSPFIGLWKGFGRRMSFSQEPNINNHFRQVLLDARNALSRTNQERCCLALEESGLICFVPSDTQAGDLICQFISSDVLAIIRDNSKIKGMYSIIGRAVNFLVSSSTIPFDVFGRSLFWVEEHEQRRVTFKFDIPTLQMMTRASETPDPPSKIPDPLL